MIKDFEILKRNYAKLLVTRGLVTTKNRIVVIDADIDQPEFVHILVEECYNAGAKKVEVRWTYRNVEKIIRERTALKDLDVLLPTEKAEIKYEIENNVCYIHLESNNPNYLKGVDPKKASAGYSLRKAFARKCRGENQYRAPFTIACVPSASWAKEIFPEMEVNQAIEKFWKLIFKICRVTKESATKGWDEHCTDIDNRAKWLNSLKIKELHYKSNNGTDIVIGMTDKYKFAGTADWDIISKKKYYSNIPTEECFVSPHKDKADGVIFSSMPLSLDGQLIEGIKLVFKKGRIVEVHAKKGESTLKELIATDEGTHHLGEAALVPYKSPIRDTGILFLNTLYDENAACHFAIGDSYSYTYEGYEKMKSKDLFKNGMNISSRHVDFMIGTKDLDIIATTFDNKKIQIFKNGNWVK